MRVTWRDAKSQYLGILFICLFVFSANAQRDYLRVKAQKGDGVFVLLARYNLDRNKCNLKKFYKINELKSGAGLALGRSYKLPVYTYKFNGKSIRSTVGFDNWQQAKEIERYNDLMTSLKLKSEDFRTGARQLWVPYHTLSCPTDLESFIPKGRNFAIFGKKYQDVPLLDKRLAGAVYYVVAGHGGPDPGAIGQYNGTDLCEDEYAYDISLRLARNLIGHGAIVYLITRDPNDGIRDDIILPCDKDEICWEKQTIPRDQKERLTQRSDMINKLYDSNEAKGIQYQRMIEVHVDSRSESERIDLFFYYYPDNEREKMLAERMHGTIKAKYAIHRKSKEYTGTIKGRDLHMLREVKPLGSFVEVANIRNKHDQKRILYPDNRQSLADWLTEGLMKDY